MPRSDEEILTVLNEAAAADREGRDYTPPTAPAEPAVESRVGADGTFHREAAPVHVQEEHPATAEEPFTDIDVSNLPPDVQAAVELHRRRMQADYTRKTQEVAAQRRQLEDRFGDLELASEAVDFYENIHGNPQYALATLERMVPALAAVGLRDQVVAAFQKAGLSPAQSQVAATQAMEDFGPDAAGPEWVSDDWDEPGTATTAADPRLDNILARLERQEQISQQIEQVEQGRLRQAAQQHQMLSVMGELQRQENVILESNQNYQEQDMDAIYALAPAVSGNLLAAQQLYEGLRMHFLQSYVGSKANTATTPGAAIHVPSGGRSGVADPHAGRERGDLEAAHEAAMARVRASMA